MMMANYEIVDFIAICIVHSIENFTIFSSGLLEDAFSR